MAWYNFWQREEVPKNEPIDTVDNVLLRALLKGEKIDKDKALTIPSVTSSVNLICDMVASIPIKLYKRDKDGNVAELSNDNRVNLLNTDTGDTLDGNQMKRALVEDYLLDKGGYIFIKKNRNNVKSLNYVEANKISIYKNTDPVFKSYTININGKNYKPFEFIKVLRNTKDGASGTGLIEDVSKAIETAYQTLLYQLDLVKTGGNKKGFIKATERLSQEAVDKLKTAWNELYKTNENNIVVLNKGLDFQESSNTSVEMQLNESKQTLKDEIKDIFQIKDNFKDTFKYAIYPILKAIETALNRDLLLEKEKKNLFFEFDVKDITKADMKERYEAYQIAKNTGFLTLNEIRKEDNRNKIEGLDVVNVGLSAVLYNTETHEYYTPNTNQTSSIQSNDTQVDDQVENNNKIEYNKDNLDLRYNHNHSAKDGRFTSGNGVLIDDRISSKKNISSSKTSYNEYEDQKRHSIEVRETKNAKEFRETLVKAKETQKENGWRVDIHDEKDYNNDKLFTTKRGSTIAITNDGDIISVCGKNTGDRKTSDSGSTLLQYAVKQGGKKLDSYDGNFRFYQKNGFEPVSWCKFDEEYAPSDWKKDKNDKENIIFFKHTGKSPIYANKEDFYSKVKVSKDYDTAMKERDDQIE